MSHCRNHRIGGGYFVFAVSVGEQPAAGAYIVVDIAVLCAGRLGSIDRHKVVGMNVSQHRSDFVSADCAGFSGGFSRFTA